MKLTKKTKTECALIISIGFMSIVIYIAWCVIMLNFLCVMLSVLKLQGMQASQVSTYLHKGVNLIADLAIDGNSVTNLGYFTCSHTGNPYQNIQLVPTNYPIGLNWIQLVLSKFELEYSISNWTTSRPTPFIWKSNWIMLELIGI